MNVDVGQLALISKIYDGVVSNHLWVDILEECARDVGAKSCILASANVVSPDEFTITAYSRLVTPEKIRDYEENYSHYDRAAWGSLQFMPAGTMLPDEEVWPDQQAPDIRPYMECFERELGVNKRVGYRLNDDTAWFEAVSFQFSLPEHSMLSYDTKRSRVLLPHFAKAVSLMRGFNVLKSRFNAVLGALDRFHIALILVKANGQVVHFNTAAHKILEARDGLRKTREGFLSVADSDLDGKIRDAIVRAAATAKAENNEADFVFKVPKASGGDGYLLEISPLKDTEREIDSIFRGSLVMVIDPDNIPEMSISGAATFYKLTSAESAVTGLLVKGWTIQEIAEERSVSPETIKSQISSVFAKTGARNRTDLMRTLLNIDLPIDRDV